MNNPDQQKPVPHIARIKDARLIDIHHAPRTSSGRSGIEKFHDGSKTAYGEYWKLIPWLMIGVNDWRARLGEYRDPYMRNVNPYYLAPEDPAGKDETLKDIADSKADAIWKHAQHTGKNIAIMWSGGIDSTFVVTAILKTVPANEHDRVAVICNSNSVYENQQFFFKFLLNRVQLFNTSTWEMTPDFLNQYILLHGDPADCLFGPSMPLYKAYVNNGTHTESWKKHIKGLYDIFEPSKEKNSIEAPGFGKWFVDKIGDNIDSTDIGSEIKSVGDFFWWTYYNFKWEFSCQRPFHFYRYNSRYQPITQEQQKEFADLCFFNDHRFQQWSFRHLNSFIGKSGEIHKREAKQYIYEFDQNQDYFDFKTKLGAHTPSNRHLYKIGAYWDENWVLVPDFNNSTNREQSAPFDTISICLQKYKG